MKYSDSIKYVKGVGEKRAALFAKLGVFDVDALLHLYPRVYRDLSNPVLFAEAPFDRPSCVRARVVSPVIEHKIRSNMTVYKFNISDGVELAEVSLFNVKYLAEKISVGQDYLFYGSVSRNYIKCEMSSPDILDISEKGLKAIYPQTSGLSSKKISDVVKAALDKCPIVETLPQNIIKKYGLCSAEYAIRNIHFPENKQALELAKRRLVFEELFFLQSGILFKKEKRSDKTDVKIIQDKSAEFEQLLPFNFTDAQQRVIKECVTDMMSGRPCRRLIQGDVGSGKTAVAASLCYTSFKNGYQSVVMAPTEILAEQHLQTFKSFFEGTGCRIALLTGAVTKSKKTKLKEALSKGEIDIIIGTHALLQDDVVFANLGLVVTDEQHRFGVEQRTTLASKGADVHMVVMSATPIPRTMSLIIFGDLDISIIDSLPLGRKPIETYCVTSSYRTRAYNYIKKHIDEGRQGYIVCPRVEEGENTSADLVAAKGYFEELKNGAFKDYRLALLHGQMKSKEKDAIMLSFAKGEIDLLIATTVIEVGINVPNAVIMLIENAERFGLSQLHQLRGRIGRGKYGSTCILMTDKSGVDTKARMKLMCSTTDGFKIADEDLKLRGPGDFLGKRQHGLPELKIADLSEDMALFRLAGNAAKELALSDPTLEKTENLGTKREILKIFNNAGNYGYN